jgi:outer membrane protein assembly factor BamE (lipoprotein component of BamABCDE complex)
VHRLGSGRTRSSISGLALVLLAGLAAALSGCGVQIDHHGHALSDMNTDLIRPGMSKQDVQDTLGSPDTTSTIGGDTYYYISSTQKSYAFLKPWETNREVVAVYFNSQQKVDHMAHYGLKDGVIVDFSHDQTPARGKEMSILAQIFGNMAQRRMFEKTPENEATPGPGL